MSLRGKVAIAGIAELPTRRTYPGRGKIGLQCEVAALAIADAGYTKRDIDGIVTEGGMGNEVVHPGDIAEYLEMYPRFGVGASMMGASSGTAVLVAAAAIEAGLASRVLVVMGATRDPDQDVFTPPPPGLGSEWAAPYGPAVAANNGYGLVYRRHMYEFGTTEEQLAHISVAQRFNALENPNAAFAGRPITLEDVINSRYTNDPLKMLECVMPCGGAAACIVVSAEEAEGRPNRRVNLLGGGIGQMEMNIQHRPQMTLTPVHISAPQAYAMAGYGPHDIEFAEFYDWYTILVAVCIEDSGLWGIKKGEIGPFYASTDTTYKGEHPINTDGGQLSAGQPGLAGGFRHFIEGVRQIMGRAGVRQVARNNLAMTNHWGGTASQMSSTILGSDETL